MVRKSRRARKPVPRWMARGYSAFAVLLMVGVVVLGVVLIVSAWHTRAQERPVSGWNTTTGTVVGVHRVAEKDGSVYGPIVSFTDRHGARHRFTAPTSSDEPTVGAPAQVSYDPNDPTQAHDLSDSSTSWVAPFVTGICLSALAGSMLALATWLLIRQRRRGDHSSRAPADAPASPRTAALVSWIPRLSVMPVAVIVFVTLQSSTHDRFIAGIATAIYVVVALGVLTLVARARQQRRSTSNLASEAPTPAGRGRSDG